MFSEWWILQLFLSQSHSECSCYYLLPPPLKAVNIGLNSVSLMLPTTGGWCAVNVSTLQRNITMQTLEGYPYFLLCGKCGLGTLSAGSGVILHATKTIFVAMQCLSCVWLYPSRSTLNGVIINYYCANFIHLFTAIASSLKIYFHGKSVGNETTVLWCWECVLWHPGLDRGTEDLQLNGTYRMTLKLGMELATN